MIEILTMKYKDKKKYKKTWFIIISPDEENFNIFIAMNKIHRHIKKLTEKY